MNDSKQLLNELKDIREIMERSNRFLSLSGLSGILVGIYALTGAFFAHQVISLQYPIKYQPEFFSKKIVLLFVIGLSVLVLSILTTLFLTIKKAGKEHKQSWGLGSKLLVSNLFIPLATGGLLIIIFVLKGYYETIIPCFLIFYGLALVNAAKYTRPEILGLGIIEILLGLIAAIFPGYGLYLWAFGFGIIHIIYGFLYLRIENKNSVK